jgi:hypothetical protein
MSKRAITSLSIVLLLGALWLLAGAQGEKESVGPEVTIGMIPGTHMTRDEFRARGQAQLNAIALNALAYFLRHNEYPKGFYDLYNSEAWNLDVANMFTGRTLDAVIYEPQGKDFTTAEIPGVTDTIIQPEQPAGSGGQAGGQGAGGEAGGGGDEQGGGGGSAQGGGNSGGVPSGFLQGPELSPLQAVPRVDPRAIKPFTAGGVFYYVNGDMLQLVMFAPDGTYVEHVDEHPSVKWTRGMGTPPGGKFWPDSLFAAQVMYFLESGLPQYYNLVLFMSDREPLPNDALGKAGAAERLKMADELGITVWNPHTKRAIAVAPQYKRGDLMEVDPQAPLPLHICMDKGAVVNLAGLGVKGASTAKPPPPQPKPEKPKPTKPGGGAPPMGGRK